MSIVSLLNQVKNNEIVLPATQRQFVWSEKQILKLLDSIMRGYSIGITLIWETYENIQFREFVSDYSGDNLLAFLNNTRKRKIKLVLDGQQRLQSLFIALYGSLDGRNLYFDILSGNNNDDLSEPIYLFYFGAEDESREWNSESKRQANLTGDDKIEDYEPAWFIKVSDLFKMSASEKKSLARKVKQDLMLSDDDVDRLSMNLEKFDDAFFKQENILRASIIDENLPHDNP